MLSLTVAAEISDGGAIPTAGQSYTLDCGTFGASGFTYQWSTTDGGDLQGQTREILSFSPLRLFDGGDYTCVATLNSRQFTSTFDVVVQGKCNNTSSYIVYGCFYEPNTINYFFQFQLHLQSL